MVYGDLKGKKVLVTGSSSGIGAATAKMFAQQGCFVGVHYFMTRAGGAKTLEAVRKASDGCLVGADLRDKNQTQKIYKNNNNIHISPYIGKLHVCYKAIALE